MEMQRIIEMLTTNQANTKATLNEIKEEMKQEIRTGQEQIQENLKRTMEEMMNTNQAKTDVKLEELSEAIEETHVEREKPTSADMKACQDAMEANPEKRRSRGAAGDS
jgi:hypothetical protein